jgi:hypothetical protein
MHLYLLWTLFWDPATRHHLLVIRDWNDPFEVVSRSKHNQPLLENFPDGEISATSRRCGHSAKPILMSFKTSVSGSIRARSNVIQELREEDHIGVHIWEVPSRAAVTAIGHHDHHFGHWHYPMLSMFADSKPLKEERYGPYNSSQRSFISTCNLSHWLLFQDANVRSLEDLLNCLLNISWEHLPGTGTFSPRELGQMTDCVGHSRAIACDSRKSSTTRWMVLNGCWFPAIRPFVSNVKCLSSHILHKTNSHLFPKISRISSNTPNDRISNFSPRLCSSRKSYCKPRTLAQDNSTLLLDTFRCNACNAIYTNVKDL